MKTRRLLTVVPAVLAISLVLGDALAAKPPIVPIKPNLQPDPLVFNGKSGGIKTSNCGNITNAPNQVIQVTESLPYLRLTVEGTGKPTLLIDGLGGRFCVLPDSYSGGKAEISGYWQAGDYSLHIGELSQGQYTYTLRISQQKK
jgi:hypothetical protein